ncbi:hypothetical protein B0H19DRAFT_1072839 [Mycena capillaripes]|nr:hypothetical protein B0H19DRAFT_1072839 [Mycena capillaripes]
MGCGKAFPHTTWVVGRPPDGAEAPGQRWGVAQPGRAKLSQPRPTSPRPTRSSPLGQPQPTSIKSAAGVSNYSEYLGKLKPRLGIEMGAHPTLAVAMVATGCHWPRMNTKKAVKYCHWLKWLPEKKKKKTILLWQLLPQAATGPE